MLKENQMKVIHYKQSRGFSLVELLVAMVVGLIIVTGAFSLHVASRKTQAVNEMQMDMVADARFAIELIAYDLRHAGMWGGTNRNGLIDCKSTNPCTVSSSASEALPAATVTGDCANGRYFDLSQPVFATNDTNTYSNCIPSTEKYRLETDVLEIHYADSNVTASADLRANQVYVRSNFINGRVFVGTTEPVLDSFNSNALTQNHALYSHTYYISTFTDDPTDGIPSLRRVALRDSTTMENQTLVSGVYDLQVQFGEDLTGDQLVDRYVDPHLVTDWSAVFSAKIWLVMRSDKQQPGVDTSPAFKDIIIADKLADTLGGVDDFRYFMISSVINLRNLKQL